jgi:predicted kinase
MKPRPTVHVICGFIGSGKTTFAKKLEQQTGAVRITKDEWLIRLIGNDPTIDGFAEYDHKICGLSRELAFYLVEKGVDVIIDEGFWARDERAEIRKQIVSLGAEHVLYYLDTPLETIRERVSRRNVSPTEDSFMISRELLDGYLSDWQPPDEDEGYVAVSAMES